MDSLKKTEVRLEYLSNIIRKCDIAYYLNNSSIIPDGEYDLYRDEYSKLIIKYPHLKKDYPINQVGVKSEYNRETLFKVKHNIPMLSLNNGFNIDDIKHFIENIKKTCIISSPEFCCEYKIDGLSFSALYSKGMLVQASTRGDGNYGEDITRNILMLKDFPSLISNKYDNFVIHGEIYMTKRSFKDLNITRKQNNEQLFSTARNAASGSIRQLNPQITKNRNLQYYTYSVYTDNKFIKEKQSDSLKLLKTLGFKVGDEYIITNDINNMMDFYKTTMQQRNNIEYDIDGIVYKLNSFQYYKQIGTTAKYPKYSIAHKFPAELGKTRLLDISFQIGKTGAITPVAELEPLKLQGVTITRATLHNFDDLYKKNIMKNDIVNIVRAGDVIPKIADVDINARDNNLVMKITPPHECPVCFSKLQKIGTILFCINQNCAQQIIEKLIHFVSKSAFNIDRLGKKQIDILYKYKYIINIIDIFTLKTHYNKLILVPGLGKRSVDKILESIKTASENITLDRLIYSLSIKHIGIRTAKILSEYFENNIQILLNTDFNDINIINKLIALDNIGDIVAKSLIAYFLDSKNMKILFELFHMISFKKIHRIETKISNKMIAITGVLSISRDQFKEHIEKLGGIFSNNISSKTDFLIYGDNSGSKLSKAKANSIKIFTEQEWYHFINEKRYS